MILDKISCRFNKIKRSDIVVMKTNKNLIIKRVIATEGDVVNIEDDGTVFVNSVKLEENYVKELSYKNGDKELWMSPNNYLMLAKNIKDYLKEYLESQIISDYVEKKYQELSEILSL